MVDGWGGKGMKGLTGSGATYLRPLYTLGQLVLWGMCSGSIKGANTRVYTTRQSPLYGEHPPVTAIWGTSASHRYKGNIRQSPLYGEHPPFSCNCGMIRKIAERSETLRCDQKDCNVIRKIARTGTVKIVMWSERLRCDQKDCGRFDMKDCGKMKNIAVQDDCSMYDKKSAAW